jgi:ribosomal protein L30/L7E
MSEKMAEAKKTKVTAAKATGGATGRNVEKKAASGVKAKTVDSVEHEVKQKVVASESKNKVSGVSEVSEVKAEVLVSKPASKSASKSASKPVVGSKPEHKKPKEQSVKGKSKEHEKVDFVTVEQYGSHIRGTQRLRKQLSSLGLGKIGKRKSLPKIPCVTVLIEKLKHLVRVVKK